MRCYMITDDVYVTAIGTGNGGTEITAAEYDQMMQIIKNRPAPPDGYDYRLRTDLTWELYEVPAVEPDPDEEISDSEALNIILGGETA